jgi:hypothetical protein
MKMMGTQFIMILILESFVKCPGQFSPDNQHDMNNIIKIEAEIIRFIPNAMRDNLDEGNFVSYDATEVQVLSPESLKGKKLMIYHTPPIDTTSVWRRENSKLKFTIEKLLIDKEYLIFSSGLRDIKEDNN